MDEIFSLPRSWVQVTVADLGKVVSGGTPSTKENSYWGGNISWISPSDLTGYSNKQIAKGAKSITQEGLKNSSATIMPAGSIHFSSRAPIGYTVISSCDMTTNQGFKSLVPAHGVFNEYIYYYFKSAKQLAESRATGTTFKEISGTAFSKLPVPLPPTNEQHRIVAKIEELFSELDKGIENLQTAQAQLKVYRQALLKHAFEGKLTAQWREENRDKLETADALLKRIQKERVQRYQQQLAEWQTHGGSKPKTPKSLPPLTAEEFAELPELPEGWGWVRLADIGDIETGTTPPKDNPSNYGNEYPFFKPTDLEAGSNVRVAREYLTKQGLSQSRFLPANSTLVTCIGATIGKVGITRVDGASNQQINSIIPSGSVLPDFVYYQASGPIFQDAVKSNASSTTLPILNKSKFEVLAIAVCSFNEQQKVVIEVESKLSEVDQLDQTIATSLQQAEALRQSILKKAFSGQLVPQDPHDEPASALLARIRAERATAEKTSAVRLRSKRG